MSTALAEVWPVEESAFDQSWDSSSSTITPDTNWREDPIGWAEMALGIPRHTLIWSLNQGYKTHRWDGTKDPMVAIAEALVAWDDCAVESATGTGKSFFAAVLLLWFIACWEGARVFTFAPKEDQLRLYIWMELGKLWHKFHDRFPSAVLTDLTVRMRGSGDDSWGARGYAVGVKADQEVAVSAQGMHAADMLLIYEETPGIPPAVILAGENTCTAPHNIRLLLGNPDHQQDTLHQAALSPGVVAIRISGMDHPNVVTGEEIIPGAVSRKSIDRRKRKYGVDHRLFQSRARGISPKESASSLIKSAWVKAAMARYDDPAYRDGPPAWGVDVANSEDGDKGAVARGLGACLLEVEAKPCPDANRLGARVIDEMKATPGGRPERVGFDSVGVGAGAVNEAKRLGYAKVQSLNGGAKAWPTTDEDQDIQPGQRKVMNVERFRNLRCQMQWQMAEDLKNGRIALPKDDELEMDLIAATWEPVNGVIVVESKEDLKERLGHSPNKGDAAVYWNWVRVRRNAKVEEEEISAFDPAVMEAERNVKYKLGPRLDRHRRRDKLRLHED